MGWDPDAPAMTCQEWQEVREKHNQEIERLRAGLEAAIRAANLAIFVIRKQGVMPNSSWQSGFEKDLATATAALGARTE